MNTPRGSRTAVPVAVDGAPSLEPVMGWELFPSAGRAALGQMGSEDGQWWTS